MKKRKIKRKIAVLAAMLSIGQSRSLAMDLPEVKIESQSNSQLVKCLKFVIPSAIVTVIALGIFKITNCSKNTDNVDLSNVSEKTGEIKLNSVKNIRFLGWKMKDKDGNLINDKAFIRSGNTNNLTPEDLAALKKLGVKAVIDLRYPDEVGREPDKFSVEPGINYRNISIFVIHGSFANANQMVDDYLCALGCFNPRTDQEVNDKNNARKNIKKIFETIANAPEGGKILFHCSHGKDRTGILSILLLSLAGVSKEDIVKNFIECYNRDGKSQVKLFTKEAVEKFIDLLTKRYGSVENFLKSKCGISDETIQKVKKRINSN